MIVWAACLYGLLVCACVCVVYALSTYGLVHGHMILRGWMDHLSPLCMGLACGRVILWVGCVWSLCRCFSMAFVAFPSDRPTLYSDS